MCKGVAAEAAVESLPATAPKKRGRHGGWPVAEGGSRRYEPMAFEVRPQGCNRASSYLDAWRCGEPSPPESRGATPFPAKARPATRFVRLNTLQPASQLKGRRPGVGAGSPLSGVLRPHTLYRSAPESLQLGLLLAVSGKSLDLAAADPSAHGPHEQDGGHDYHRGHAPHRCGRH